MVDIIKLEESVKKCKNIRTKKYKKGELITTYIANRTQIGIILEGSADLIRYDIDGNKKINATDARKVLRHVAGLEYL